MKSFHNYNYLVIVIFLALLNLFKSNLKNATTKTNSRVHKHDIGRVPGLRMGERPVDIQGSHEISHTFGTDE